MASWLYLLGNNNIDIKPVTCHICCIWYLDSKVIVKAVRLFRYKTHSNIFLNDWPTQDVVVDKLFLSYVSWKNILELYK